MTDFTKVPVGTTVYSLTRGKGVIQQIYSEKQNIIYPVTVSYGTGFSDSFTKDGRFFDRDVIPTLYLNPPKVVEEITIEVDTPVWVRMEEEPDWVPRHATGEFNKGRIMCWALGRTSHSVVSFSQTQNTHVWDEYSLTDPNAAD